MIDHKVILNKINVKKKGKKIIIGGFTSILLAGCGSSSDSSSSGTTPTEGITPVEVIEFKIVNFQITEPVVPSDDSVVISWTQSEYTSKSVEYGLTKKYGSKVLIEEEGIVKIDNLEPNTVYHYRLIGEDSKGRKILSRDNTFTTLEEVIIDTVAPVITINGSSNIEITEGDSYSDLGATAIDNIDGTVSVTVSGSVDNSTIGTYTITYSATDKAGNTSTKIRTIDVIAMQMPIVPDPTDPECLIGSTSVLGQVLDRDGNGLENIEINIDGCKAVSNSEGFYQLLNVSETENTMIRITSTDYATAFVPIKIELFYEGTTDPSNNYIKTVLTPYSTNMDTHIVLPDSLKEAQKKIFRYSRVNTKDERRNFPGLFKGIDSNGVDTLFQSYGLIELDLRNEDNKQLAVNDPITLIFNAQPEIIEDELTLWKYSEENQIWMDYGLAIRDADGTFISDVEELGLYSINKPFTDLTGLYIGRIVFEDGSPAKDLRVYLTGENWISYTLTTNDLGEFEIPVKGDTQFSIYAYTYRDDYKAEYSGPALPMIDIGGVNDDRS